MTLAGTVLAPAQETDTISDACGSIDASYACEQVYEWTENKFLANSAEWGCPA